MTNAEISAIFTSLSRLMDVHGEDSFKAKSYSVAAFQIDQLPQELSTMSPEAIAYAKGIGQSTAKKIIEILNTGRLSQLEDLLQRTPPGVLEILQIKGLGPKKVRSIWQEMGIESVGELEYACNENRLASFKGFGQKTQEAVLQQIAFIQNNQGFYLWAEAHAIAETWMNRLQKSFSQYQFAYCGDYYQQNNTLATLEIVTDIPFDLLPRLWANAPGIDMQASESTLRLQLPDNIPLQFYFAPKGQVAVEQFKRSASDEFLEHFALHYQLPIDPNDEAAIFAHNDLDFVPAPLRTSNKVLGRPTPKLIQANDVKGIIHAHSKWSDGQETLEVMVQELIKRGMQYLVITDHSQAAYYAGGLTPDRVAAQQLEIDMLNKKYCPFKVFKGIEADILNDGSLDYDAAVLATFDIVIASVHSNLKMNEEKAMQRLLAAIQNPYTTILGHPSGRLLLSRQAYPLDYKMIIDACKENDVVIEINAHPRRLDLDWQWVAHALEQDVLLSVNPDAHALEGFDDVYYGCIAAQKGGLTAAHNLSSYTLEELERFIELKKRKRNLRPL